MSQRIEPVLVLPADDAGVQDEESLPRRSPVREIEDEDSRRVVWFVMIVAGTAIGCLIAYFAARWYEERQVEIALQQFQRTVSQASISARREAAALTERMAAAQAAERERLSAAAARNEATKRQAAELEARHAAAVQLEAEQKEAAWARYYRPSEECRNPDNRASMTCANEHARAKREFESRWARGEFRS